MLDAFSRIRPWRMLVLVAYDTLIWIGSYAGLWVATRFSKLNEDFPLEAALIAGVASAAAYIAIGAVFRLHQGRAPLGSFEEAVLLAGVASIVGLVGIAINLAYGPFYRWSVALGAPAYALVVMFAGRALYRLTSERSSRHGNAADSEPAVIIGAGDSGSDLTKALLRTANAPWYPVAILDDDPMLRHRRVERVAVAGRIKDLPEVARRTEATTAILAISTASAELVKRTADLASAAGLKLKVLPALWELPDPDHVTISDVRDLNLTDLLGRTPIDTDVASIAGYLTDKRVLVTGAGGSIGSELCRQIAAFEPEQLYMLDRDESALHAVELSLHGRALLDDDATVLADIRDLEALRAVFAKTRPHVVFHAAALKHLPMLEKAPAEAIKTNVWGTFNVLTAAAEVGVGHFVNVSTDKAANPTSVLGYSKRLAEGLTTAFSPRYPGTYLSVRFGNVLGSRGSVLTAFASQIAAGGPITVTHPEVTRYFMTIREAVQLVIQAGAIGADGEALVLDMGEPVSIEGVARQLIDLSGQDIDIVYTGLREGEKMHEELFGAGEVDQRPRHPLISHTHVPGYHEDDALRLTTNAATAAIINELREAVADMQARLLAAEGNA